MLERESGVLLPPLPGESRGEAKGADLEESGELGLLLLHLLPNNLNEIDRERNIMKTDLTAVVDGISS